MYRWLRNIHLLVGLGCLFYLLMYGVSSVKMAHPRWFGAEPPPKVSRVMISPEGAASARGVARELMDEHGLRGAVRRGRATPAGFAFQISRPGADHDVSFNKSTGEAVITTHPASFMGMLAAIHEQGGIYHESALKNVWGGFVGVVSLGVFVLTITGIYLWWMLRKERVIGSILLGAGLLYSVALIIVLRAA